MNAHQSPITYSFDVHGLVRVVVFADQKTNLLEQVNYQLRLFSTNVDIPTDKSEIEIYNFSYFPHNTKPAFSKIPYFLEKEFFVIPSENFAFHLGADKIRIYCDNFLIPLNFFVELILLRKGWTLIHAAAVQVNGLGVLLPALGGVGKTTAIAGLVQRGAKLFGDDLVIVKDSEILSYPVDLSIYHYHLKVLSVPSALIRLRLKFSRILDQIAKPIRASRSLLFRIVSRIIDHFRTPCFSIPVTDIFDSESIASKAKIARVFFLKRSGTNGTSLEVKTTTADELSRTCTDILMHEWHQSLRWLLLYSILSRFDIAEFRLDIQSCIRSVFSKVKCEIVQVPSAMRDSEYQSQLDKILRNE